MVPTHASRADDPEAVAALLRGALADPGTAWSLGSFGAIAEFFRDADEPVADLDDGRLGLSTARGAVALTPVPDLRPLAYETSIGAGWNHAVALCLPEAACAGDGRTVVTELGPDRAAARPEDRDAILFDLGLGLRAVDACVRTADPETLACLRAGAGRPVFDPASPIGPRLVAHSPHRVFRARIGRIEVYAPIPAPGAASPDGPHTHVLPAMIRLGRTHAATTPIPAGWVPCAALHPAHPCKDMMGRPISLDLARHAAFQALLDRWGDPDLVAIKRGGSPGPEGRVSARHAQGARRVAEIQARTLRGETVEAAADEAEPDEIAAMHAGTAHGPGASPS